MAWLTAMAWQLAAMGRSSGGTAWCPLYPSSQAPVICPKRSKAQNTRQGLPLRSLEALKRRTISMVWLRSEGVGSDKT